jgi:DNA-binding transcriptional regulator LsrR (DeoR family)
MAKLRRNPGAALADDAALRLRAAWLYHGFGLTQSEVADQLGIGRSTVIRLLEEARQRGEVKITIEDRVPDLAELSLSLERRLGLDEAIVVPAPEGGSGTARAVGLALGRLLSEAISDNDTIGVGWGRTLSAALESFSPPRRSGVKVMSLMGGAVETQFANPFEFAWRLATALQAECFLFPAPLVVDSAETRERLMADRSIARLAGLASALDLAVVSAGGLADSAGSLVRQLITEGEAAELLTRGCVADIMCNFIDAEGRPVDHPLNRRIMSVGIETLQAARHKVLASGGRERAPAILAVVRSIGCNTLVTDEHAARALLERS